VLTVSQFEIRGPFNATGVSETPSRRRIFTCYPQAESEERACAEQIISRLAYRAFRRPLNADDMKSLMNFYAEGRKASDFEGGVRLALTAILASPDFLYRAELDPSATP